jgi:hypothetical protein
LLAFPAAAAAAATALMPCIRIIIIAATERGEERRREGGKISIKLVRRRRTKELGMANWRKEGERENWVGGGEVAKR